MIGVVVTGSHYVDKVELVGGYGALGHADVGFVGGGVFFCERIGEVGIEEEEAGPPF